MPIEIIFTVLFVLPVFLATCAIPQALWGSAVCRYSRRFHTLPGAFAVNSPI